MSDDQQPLCLCLAVMFALAVVMVNPASSQNLAVRFLEREDVLATELPFQANGIVLQQALQEISRLTGIVVIVTAPADGAVSLRDPRATLGSTLAEISAQSDVVWWYDGAAIRIEPRSGMSSLLVPLGDIPATLALEQLRALDLVDPRFPLRASQGGDFLRVVGPMGYGDAVKDVVGQLAVRLADRQRAIRQAASSDPVDPAQAALAGLPVIVRGRVRQ